MSSPLFLVRRNRKRDSSGLQTSERHLPAGEVHVNGSLEKAESVSDYFTRKPEALLTAGKLGFHACAHPAWAVFMLESSTLLLFVLFYFFKLWNPSISSHCPFPEDPQRDSGENYTENP